MGRDVYKRIVTFKADPEEHDVWKEAAYRQNISLGAWIRNLLNRGVLLPELPTLEKLATSSRATGCEHRLPIGAWCKQCQVIRK